MPIENPIDTINKLLDLFVKEQRGYSNRPGIRRLDEYLHGIQDDPFKPHDPSTRQYRTLMDRSKLNLLDLVVKTRAQGLKAESVRGNDPDASAASCWQYFTDNKWESRQTQVWQTALAYGVAYATVLPGQNVFTKKKGPVLTAKSPRHFMAFYDDPANDDWPEAAIEVHGLTDKDEIPAWGGDSRAKVDLWDDYSVRSFIQGDKEGAWQQASETAHKAPVCPVGRAYSELDLDGRCWGEIEDLIDTQNRLNQALFGLLMVETFNSFKIRWISGVMAGEVDEEGNPVDPEAASQARIKMSQDILLAFPDADTKVGSLDETDMTPFINSALFAIRQFAIKSQTPPQNFLGDIGGNIAADALSALESSAARKTAEKKTQFSDFLMQMLRLCSVMDGNKKDAKDMTLKVKWAETETRSLAQVADAWGKIAVMLEVPPEQIWERIPEVTMEDVQRWKEAKKIADAKALTLALAGGGTDGSSAGKPGGNAGSSSVVRPAAGQLGSAFGPGTGANATASDNT